MHKNDKRQALVVCLLVLLAMGFSGWYENYVPVPQPTVQQMMQACDREAERSVRMLVSR